MNKLSVYAKKENTFIRELNNHYDFQKIKLLSKINKLIFMKQVYPDIYFHSGRIDKNSINMIKNSKKTIVNSFNARHKIILKKIVSDDKIEVIYPSIEIKEFKPKQQKQKLLEELNISDKKVRLIMFSASNFKASGFKEFLEIISKLNYENFIALAVGNSAEIYKANFQIEKYGKLKEKIKTIELADLNSDRHDMLFQASDIYILPSHASAFSTNVLKAMAGKCAVFVTANNDAREIVDVFATMESPSDPSTTFKVDALLSRKDDLKLIKKQNYKAVQEFTLEKNLEKLKTIADSIISSKE